MRNTVRSDQPLSAYLEEVCRTTDVKGAYLIIRSKCPVSYKQVKKMHKIINN